MEHLYTEQEVRYYMAKAATMAVEGYKEGVRAGYRTAIRGLIGIAILSCVSVAIAKKYEEDCKEENDN